MEYEDIKLEGHIIDSMVLPRVLDDILDLGRDFRFLHFQVGRRNSIIRVRLSACRPPIRSNLSSS